MKSKIVLFYFLIIVSACNTPKKSTGIFLNDYQLKYRNKTFVYFNSFYALNKPIYNFNYKKYYTFKKGEVLDYVLKNAINFKYYIIGTTLISSKFDLLEYKNGLTISIYNDPNNIYNFKKSTISSIDIYSIFVKKDNIKSDSINVRYQVSLKNIDTIHSLIFLLDSNNFPNKDYDGLVYGEIQNFSKDKIIVHPFVIDSSLLSSKRYIKSKTRKAKEYLLFFNDKLDSFEKNRIQSFIDDFKK